MNDSIVDDIISKVIAQRKERLLVSESEKIEDSKKYALAKSLFGPVDPLEYRLLKSDLRRIKAQLQKGGDEAGKRFKPIRDWALARAHEVRDKKPNISQSAIAKIVLGEYLEKLENKEWETPLSGSDDFGTIYKAWILKDKTLKKKVIS